MKKRKHRKQIQKAKNNNMKNQNQTKNKSRNTYEQAKKTCKKQIIFTRCFFVFVAPVLFCFFFKQKHLLLAFCCSPLSFPHVCRCVFCPLLFVFFVCSCFSLFCLFFSPCLLLKCNLFFFARLFLSFCFFHLFFCAFRPVHLFCLPFWICLFFLLLFVVVAFIWTTVRDSLSGFLKTTKKDLVCSLFGACMHACKIMEACACSARP